MKCPSVDPRAMYSSIPMAPSHYNESVGRRACPSTVTNYRCSGWMSRPRVSHHVHRQPEPPSPNRAGCPQPTNCRRHPPHDAGRRHLSDGDLARNQCALATEGGLSSRLPRRPTRCRSSGPRLDGRADTWRTRRAIAIPNPTFLYVSFLIPMFFQITALLATRATSSELPLNHPFVSGIAQAPSGEPLPTPRCESRCIPPAHICAQDRSLDFPQFWR